MAKTPIWKSIRSSIEQEISDGIYGPGEKLPTEQELTQRFGVNRHTIRHALAALADDGIVRSRRGSGVFVASQLTSYPIGKRVRFHQNIAKTGRLPQKTVLRLETRKAGYDERTKLGLPAYAQVHVYEGLSLANDEALGLFCSVFPADRFAALPAAIEQDTSVTNALRACGVSDYTRVETLITAERASPTQALHLGIREGDPVLKTTSVNADAEGTPIEFGTTFFVADKVTLTIQPN